jgi:FAD/FMN-containing dehydrogenase
MIGGNLATNAGGINFIKHNSMHANCIGLKAVLPSGDILDNMTTLRKDNTGYDLKQLFIGAEGTLGVITECAMLCGPLAKHKNMVLLSCKSFEDVLAILRKARTDLQDVVRAVEFMDWESMDIVVRNFGSKYPFTIPY